jgi:uncharacterized protein YcbK (DUF882 family)
MDPSISPVPVLADGIYFKVSELACHDGTPYPVEFADRLPVLMNVLDTIRAAWGGPLEVISGYRSPAHNEALIEQDEANGSHQVASGSQHVEGRACDLRAAGGPGTVPQVLRVVLQLYADGKLPDLGGVGDYPTSNWVHVDVRPQVPAGHLARWKGV